MQRRLRYRSRCPLYLYGEARIRTIIRGLPVRSATIEPIARDFFVTLAV